MLTAISVVFSGGNAVHCFLFHFTDEPVALDALCCPDWRGRVGRVTARRLRGQQGLRARTQLPPHLQNSSGPNRNVRKPSKVLGSINISILMDL